MEDSIDSTDDNNLDVPDDSKIISSLKEIAECKF